MDIKYFMPLWGNEHMPLHELFSKIKDEGYDGIEMQVPTIPKDAGRLKELLKKFDLLLIAQQSLSTKMEHHGAYIEKMLECLNGIESFEPHFINSHTGKDYYSFEDNCRIIKAANLFSQNSGIDVYHETHRGRSLYSAPITKLYFDAIPDLKITADFSHWCCVSESLMEGQEDVMEEAFRRTRYIHARVGYSQGPQVNHPESSEHEKALRSHISWWSRIILNARESGQKTFSVCTEFGPEPYLQTLPFDGKPVADQWEINLRMKDLLIKEFDVET